MANHLIACILIGIILRGVCIHAAPPVVVFLLDSFRLDFAYRIRTLTESRAARSHLWTLIEEGAFASEGVSSGVVSSSESTLDQYTLVTGFSQESRRSNEQVEETTYDLDTNRTAVNLTDDVDSGRPLRGEPIWDTFSNGSTDRNHSVACYDWYGCPHHDRGHGGQTSRIDSWADRVEMTTQWIKNGIRLVLVTYSQLSYKLRWSESDGYTVADEELLEVDLNVGILISELKRNDFFDKVNLIIVGGHTRKREDDPKPTGVQGNGHRKPLNDTRGTFIGRGPAFVPNSTIAGSLRTADVYPLMCRLTNVTAAPNDGSTEHFHTILTPAYEPPRNQAHFGYFVIIVGLLTSMLFGGLIIAWICHSKRTLEDEFDDESLLAEDECEKTPLISPHARDYRDYRNIAKMKL